MILNTKNSVCIFIFGIGDKLDKSPKYNDTDENIIEIIEYGTEGVIKDVITLFKDFYKLKNDKLLIEKPRLTKLVELLKFYLLYTDLNIIIFGVSHGSLIIHGAILKLKMIDIDNKFNFNRIKIRTLGSPRYFPKELLENNDIYHLYNINDFIYKFKRLYGFKFPIFPLITDSKFELTKKFNKIEIYTLRNDNFIFIRFFDPELNIFKYHSNLINLTILFDDNMPEIIKCFYYVNPQIYNFDRKLFAINLRKISNEEIMKQLTELTELKELKELKFDDYDNKIIFQLHYLYFKNIYNGIIINLNNCKDNLNLLSLNQILKCLENKRIIKTQPIYKFEYITAYNKYLNELIERNLNIYIHLVELINLLKHLSKFNRDKFINNLKQNTLDLSILNNLDYDIINSIIFFQQNLMN